MLADGLRVAAEQVADLLSGESDRVTVRADIQPHRTIRALIALDFAHSLTVHCFRLHSSTRHGASPRGAADQT